MAGEATKKIDKEVLWGGGRSPFSLSYGKMMMWFFLVSDALTFSGLLVAFGFIRHKVTVAWPAGEEVFRALPGLDGDYPLIYVALMTFILIVSSVTMVLAVEAGHRMDKKGVIKWMVLTVVGGAFFVGSQAWEWYHFIHGSHYGVALISEGDYAGMWAQVTDPNGTIRILADNTIITGEHVVGWIESAKVTFQGANMEMNEYAPQIPQYANFFFFVTGFHGFHVFSGVIINLIVTIMAFKGVFHRRGHYEMIEKAGLYWHFVDLVWVFVFTFFYLV